MVAAMMRVLVVVGLLGSAWVHLDLWLVGYQDIEVIGSLFLVNVVAGVVIAVAVVFWRHWLPALAAVGFGIATLGAFLLSLTTGLFGMENVFGGASQILAALAEVLCIAGGGALLVAERAAA